MQIVQIPGSKALSQMSGGGALTHHAAVSMLTASILTVVRVQAAVLYAVMLSCAQRPVDRATHAMHKYQLCLMSVPCC